MEHSGSKREKNSKQKLSLRENKSTEIEISFFYSLCMSVHNKFSTGIYIYVSLQSEKLFYTKKCGTFTQWSTTQLLKTMIL